MKITAQNSGKTLVFEFDHGNQGEVAYVDAKIEAFMKEDPKAEAEPWHPIFYDGADQRNLDDFDRTDGRVTLT